MNLERRNLLEAEGFQVIETELDPYWNTGTFIVTPDGRTLADYSNLSDIPLLPEGTELAIDDNAMPIDNISGNPTAQVNSMALLKTETEFGANRELVISLLGFIAVVIISVAVCYCVYHLTNPQVKKPPCGTEVTINDISDCAKMIVLPNCDSRLYNACTDEWLEDSWHTWEPPMDWWVIAVIGAVAIGGIYLLSKALGSRSRHQYAQDYPSRSPRRSLSEAVASRLYRG